MIDCPTTGSAPPDETVPDVWPPITRKVPSPTLRIRGMIALPGMVLLWFMPKRVGVCLAGAGWRPAIVAHLLSLALGWGLICWMEDFLPIYTPKPGSMFDLGPRPFPEMTVGELLRLPFASLVISVHGGTVNTAGVVHVSTVFIGFEIGLVAVALAMMPYAAAGESTRRLFGRCLRLTWWSSTFLLLLGFGWLLDPWWRKTFGLPNVWLPIDFMPLALGGVWWLMILLRSGYRYAGPAEGPAWEPRKPRCESCGYNIARLATTGRCPECGRPIADSLPDRRARVSPIQPGRFGWLSSFWPTINAVLSDRTFFDRLPVERGHARARVHLLFVCAVCAISACVSIPFIGLALSIGVDVPSGSGFVALLGCGFVAFCGLVIVGGLTSLTVCAIGKRPLQRSAVASFYALSTLVPLATLPILLGAAWLLVWLMVNDHAGAVGVLRAVAILVVSFAVAGALCVIVRAVRVFRSMLRNTHYANG